MSAMASNHRRLDCLLNSLFMRRSKKHQNSATLAFVQGIHRWMVNSPHTEPVTRKMFPFDDVVMKWNGKIVTLTHFSLLVAPEVVMTTSDAASDDKFVNMTTFAFQCTGTSSAIVLFYCVGISQTVVTQWTHNVTAMHRLHVNGIAAPFWW